MLYSFSQICSALVDLAKTKNVDVSTLLNDLEQVNWDDLKKLNFDRVCSWCNKPYRTGNRYSRDHFCPQCWTPERHKISLYVYLQVRRAERYQLPATLTPKEWFATLKYFGWKCAYCQVGPYDCIEHFVPIKQGGGTTRGNCVPACTSCDKKKRSTHPDLIKSIPQEDLKRVRKYLKRFS